MCSFVGFTRLGFDVDIVHSPEWDHAVETVRVLGYVDRMSHPYPTPKYRISQYKCQIMII